MAADRAVVHVGVWQTEPAQVAMAMAMDSQAAFLTVASPCSSSGSIIQDEGLHHWGADIGKSGYCRAFAAAAKLAVECGALRSGSCHTIPK